MLNVEDALNELAETLASADIRVQLRPERLASSVLYDATYNLILLSHVFATCSKRIDNKLSISVAKLRLFQFSAARPELVDDLEQWLIQQRKRQPRLEDWPKFPRGYLTECTHEGLINYLELMDCVRLIGDNVVESANVQFLLGLSRTVEENSIFEREREIIARLARHHISKKSLGADQR